MPQEGAMNHDPTEELMHNWAARRCRSTQDPQLSGQAKFGQSTCAGLRFLNILWAGLQLIAVLIVQRKKCFNNHLAAALEC